eukprot:3658560-Pleurochrysis_carterae.AAC.4
MAQRGRCQLIGYIALVAEEVAASCPRTVLPSLAVFAQRRCRSNLARILRWEERPPTSCARRQANSGRWSDRERMSRSRSRQGKGFSCAERAVRKRE